MKKRAEPAPPRVMVDLVDQYGDRPRLPPEPRELDDDAIVAWLRSKKYERPYPRYD
jgi:hypothetical protein